MTEQAMCYVAADPDQPGAACKRFEAGEHPNSLNAMTANA